MRHCCIEIVVNFWQGKLWIHLIVAKSVRPPTNCDTIKIAVVNLTIDHVLLCRSQPAVFILQCFKTSNRHQAQPLAARESPLAEKVAEIIKVFDICLRKFLRRAFQATLLPRVHPIVPFRKSSVLTLHLAIFHCLHIRTWAMPIKHFDFLTI